MKQSQFGWHFTNGKTLRYSNEPVPEVGQILKMDPKDVKICSKGFHWSKNPHQAFTYGRDIGTVLHLVYGGDIKGRQSDKCVSSSRSILATIDMRQTFIQMMKYLLMDDFRVYKMPAFVWDWLMGDNSSDCEHKLNRYFSGFGLSRFASTVKHLWLYDKDIIKSPVLSNELYYLTLNKRNWFDDCVYAEFADYINHYGIEI